MSATIMSDKILVTRALERDRANSYFRERYNGMTSHLKSRPGHRRNYVFDQVAAGNASPWAISLEAIDEIADNGTLKSDATWEDVEADVMAYAQAWVDYAHNKFARREVESLTPKAALTLALHSDADEMKPLADALADPSTTKLIEAVNALDADTRCNQITSKSLRERIAETALKVGRTHTW